MRRPLGSFLPALLLTGLLTGCGDDSSTVAEDPAPSGATATDPPSAEPAGYTLVTTITATAAGGSVSDVGVPLGDDAAVTEFVSQFTSPALPQQLQDAIAGTDVPDGQELYGAVVAIGCDSPDQVTVDQSGDGVTITAVKVASPLPECLAAMTTVALVLVDK